MIDVNCINCNSFQNIQHKPIIGFRQHLEESRSFKSSNRSNYKHIFQFVIPVIPAYTPKISEDKWIFSYRTNNFFCFYNSWKNIGNWHEKVYLNIHRFFVLCIETLQRRSLSKIISEFTIETLPTLIVCHSSELWLRNVNCKIISSKKIS